MWDKVRQSVQQINGVIAAGTADVDMLPKYGGLLDEIPKVLQRTLIALVVAHLLALPFLKRMSAAAANFKVMVGRRLEDHLLHGGKLHGGLIDVAADVGGHLQHAFGDIVFHLSGAHPIFHCGNQRRRVLAQVITRRIHHLHFQFNAEGIRFRDVKIG